MQNNLCLKNQYLATMARMLLIVVLFFCLHTADATIGACYGTLGDNLPPPEEVISLCHEHRIRRIRLYNPNPAVLQALQGQNISVVVGVPNEDIQAIAASPAAAMSWVQNNVLKYRHVNFRYIAVGNEITPTSDPGIAPAVAPAMQNIRDALSAYRRGRRVRVSTAFSVAVLATTYPPSAGAFRSEFQDSFMGPIVKFLVNTNSSFLINLYPYFAYVSDPTHIRLDYALFTSRSTVVADGRYQYWSLFKAMLDAVHAALEKAGGANVEVVVTETGWPSAGGTATSVENARIYNSNLIKSARRGSPRRPRKGIETYVFDLIDENQKSPELEKHWGVFLPDKQPKYPLSFY